jgi:hypothetical protein
MKADEKARELFQIYLHILLDAEADKQEIDESAKKCALIAVEEMLDFRNRLYINEGSLAHQYLMDIKNEIEKL